MGLEKAFFYFILFHIYFSEALKTHKRIVNSCGVKTSQSTLAVALIFLFITEINITKPVK